MLRKLVLLVAFFFCAISLWVTGLALDWKDPDIPNLPTLLPLATVAIGVAVGYFQRFGAVHINKLNRGGSLTLWLSGLMTTGLMVFVGIVWGLLFGKISR
ncbi:MAG TPA: hypothetical protein V6C89_13045 [Drouetiella sp.]|jgi:hypothetical protein